MIAAFLRHLVPGVSHAFVDRRATILPPPPTEPRAVPALARDAVADGSARLLRDRDVRQTLGAGRETMRVRRGTP